jgi:hypothetical protein
MKKICFSVILFAVTLVQAQTLTQSFNEPVAGDVDKILRLDTSGYPNGLPHNITGSNCSWDFRKLTGTFPIIVDSFLIPSAAPGASLFPSATYAQHRDQLYSFYKSVTGTQQTELLGAYSPSLTLTFTNSAIIAGYPVSYGYNLTDGVSGSFKYNSTNGACNGAITISADGVGTVTLYDGSLVIPNVLRLKSVEILTLSVGVFPFGTFNQTIYNYYKPGKKFPILNINYTTYQLIAGTPTITAYANGTSDIFTIQGVNENYAAQNIQVYPNPFHSTITITGEQTGNEYALYSMSGQLIVKTTEPANVASDDLPPGIYLVEIRNKTGSYRQKVIKE